MDAINQRELKLMDIRERRELFSDMRSKMLLALSIETGISIEALKSNPMYSREITLAMLKVVNGQATKKATTPSGKKATTPHGFKKCPKCDIVKLMGDFYKHGKRRGSAYCKSCTVEVNRKYYATDKFKAKAKAKDRYKASRIMEGKSYSPRAPKLDPIEKKRRKAEYNRAHPKKKKYSELTEERKQKIRDYVARQRRNNPEKFLAKKRRENQFAKELRVLQQMNTITTWIKSKPEPIRTNDNGANES